MEIQANGSLPVIPLYFPVPPVMTCVPQSIFGCDLSRSRVSKVEKILSPSLSASSASASRSARPTAWTPRGRSTITRSRRIDPRFRVIARRGRVHVRRSPTRAFSQPRRANLPDRLQMRAIQTKVCESCIPTRRPHATACTYHRPASFGSLAA